MLACFPARRAGSAPQAGARRERGRAQRSRLDPNMARFGNEARCAVRLAEHLRVAQTTIGTADHKVSGSCQVRVGKYV